MVTTLTRTLGICSAGAAGLLSAAVLTAVPRPAQACGGCFSPPDTVTTVNSHRMVVALAADKATLWDQIQYEGAPEDFVWVLPIPTEHVEVDVSEGIFFDTIEAYTAPTVSSPPLNCPQPADGDDEVLFGCASRSADFAAGGDDGGDGDGDDGVTVFETDVVGPYATVVIGSEDANALYTWLNENGYNVPVETVPTIEHYVGLGSKFLVLRLAPGEGVQAMQPIRVTYPGFMGTFPLRMVTVGASGALGLSLWIVAEQRYAITNYGELELDPVKLSYDWASQLSNYTLLFDQSIDEAGGRAWVTEFAQPLANITWAFPPELSDEVALMSHGHTAPYLTRLRTYTLVENLTEDLELGPSAKSNPVDNNLIAGIVYNAPCPVATGFSARSAAVEQSSCRVLVGSRAGTAAAPLALGVLLIAVARRRRRASTAEKE